MHNFVFDVEMFVCSLVCSVNLFVFRQKLERIFSAHYATLFLQTRTRPAAKNAAVNKGEYTLCLRTRMLSPKPVRASTVSRWKLPTTLMFLSHLKMADFSTYFIVFERFPASHQQIYNISVSIAETQSFYDLP